MNDNITWPAVAIALAVACMVLFGAVFYRIQQVDRLQKQAITYGYAEWDVNRNFKWKSPKRYKEED